MQQQSSGTEPDDPVENIPQSENNHEVFEIPEETKPSAADNRVNMTKLEAVVESVLDRKLKPITKMLADAQHKETTAKDIFGGIGYILGLVGIAAYVHSRKKKGD
jgi:nickel transport protein